MKDNCKIIYCPWCKNHVRNVYSQNVLLLCPVCVLLYRIMTTTRTNNTKKPFETPVSGEDKISQVTPALRPDQF